MDLDSKRGTCCGECGARVSEVTPIVTVETRMLTVISMHLGPCLEWCFLTDPTIVLLYISHDCGINHWTGLRPSALSSFHQVVPRPAYL